MSQDYLVELFDTNQQTTIPGGYLVPVMSKSPFEACSAIPDRETVISDLLAAFPHFEYEQIAYLVSSIHGVFDRDEVEFIDRCERQGMIVAPSDHGVMMN